MEIGDKVSFIFGKKEEKKEGIVERITEKKVHIKVDFATHKGKTIVRKKHEL